MDIWEHCIATLRISASKYLHLYCVYYTIWIFVKKIGKSPYLIITSEGSKVTDVFTSWCTLHNSSPPRKPDQFLDSRLCWHTVRPPRGLHLSGSTLHWSDRKCRRQNSFPNFFPFAAKLRFRDLFWWKVPLVLWKMQLFIHFLTVLTQKLTWCLW